MEENLENNLIKSLEEFNNNLLIEDNKIKLILLDEKKNILVEIKEFIKILATIVCAIIPFSSLIFTINKDIMQPNYYFWGLSIIVFIISLFILLFSYLDYTNKLVNKMINQVLSYDPIDLINYELHKDQKDKLYQNLSDLNSHFKKQTSTINELNAGIFETDLIANMQPNIKVSLYFMLSGFIILFISIFYERLINVLSLLFF